MHVVLSGSLAESLVNFRGRLIIDLVADGHRVSAVAPEINPRLRAQLREMGADVHEVTLTRSGLNPTSDLRYMLEIKRLLRKLSPDLLINYTAKPNIWGALAARAAGVRSVSMITGLGYFFTDTGEANLRQKLVGKVIRSLYRAATDANWRVVFQNDDDRELFLATRCLNDARKAVMMRGSGVDLKKYAEASLPDSPIFLMIARLLGAKGVRDYAAAAEIVRAKYPNAEFQLLGPRDMGPDRLTDEEIATLPEKGINWLGETDDVRPYIAAARIYVLPSYYREGTPRSTLEAMAMGRPIITTDAPGCRETVIHGENGFLVPVRDPNALARAMERFICEPSLCEEMGRSSLALARDRFEVGAVNAKLMRDLEISLEG